MILNFDRGYGQSAEQMVQSLMESTQMAFDNLERKLGLPRGSLIDNDGNVITDKIEANNVITDKIEANNVSVNGIPIKDIKIEVGTSGNWTYEKWSSGIVKMYYTGTYSSAFNNGNYFGAYRGTAQTLTYPFTLASVTSVNVDHVAPNTGFCVLSTYDTTNIKFYPYNRTNQKATQTGIKVIAEVVGRW